MIRIFSENECSIEKYEYTEKWQFPITESFYRTPSYYIHSQAKAHFFDKEARMLCNPKRMQDTEYYTCDVSYE